MSAVSVYRQKIQLGGYEKSVEAELKIYKGELPVLPRSQRWEREWGPFRQTIEKMAGQLPTDVVGRGIVIAKVMEAKKYLTGMFINTALASAYAAQAVKALMDIGVPRDRAVSIVADAVGISKSLIEKVMGGGGGGGGGGAAQPGA